jgi:hypothetical protein
MNRRGSSHSAMTELETVYLTTEFDKLSHQAKEDCSSMSTPKPMNKCGLFAPASPSSNAASYAPRKHNLHPTETGMAIVNFENGFILLTYL